MEMIQEALDYFHNIKRRVSLTQYQISFLSISTMSVYWATRQPYLTLYSHSVKPYTTKHYFLNLAFVDSDYTSCYC